MQPMLGTLPLAAQVRRGRHRHGCQLQSPRLGGNMWSNPGEIAGDNIDNDNNGFVDDIRDGISSMTTITPWMIMAMERTAQVPSEPSAIMARSGGCQLGRIPGCPQIPRANGSGTEADAADAIMYATQLKRAGVQINVTSNSWGGNEFSQTLFDAVTINGKEGMLFIAAAGNSNSNNEVANFYPSNFPHDSLISVAATDRFDNNHPSLPTERLA